MTMAASDRGAFLQWPDRRNCDWDCPWPSYCVDCHSVAVAAMWDARKRLVAVLTQTPLDRVVIP